MSAARKRVARPRPTRTAEQKEKERLEHMYMSARATYQVDTSDSLAPASVRLLVLGSDRSMGPDQRVFVEVVSRFPVDPNGMYQYPAWTVRASELDDIVDQLRAAIDEGRRRFVIPPKEDPEETFQRVMRLREGPLKR